MSKFIRTIGRAALNGFHFDLYENKNGTATIRPARNLHDLPPKHWVKFKSLDEVETMIDKIDLEGVVLVKHLINKYLD